jgi:hypothetical protein
MDRFACVGPAAYRDVADTVRQKREITPAAEWLIDNFHIVEEHIRGIWSAGFHPIGVEADAYDVIYSEDRAKILQRRRAW